MKTRAFRRKPFIVDGESYEASLTAAYQGDAEPLALRLTIRAQFGHRSFCTVRGLTNQERWHNYSEFDPRQVIALTPNVIAGLIRFAHQRGWNPYNIKSNFELEADNKLIRSLMPDNR